MIELYDGYFISIDSYNYALMKHTNYFDKQTGKEIPKSIAYCSSLLHALETFANVMAKSELQDENLTIGEAIAKIQYEYHRLQEFLQTSLPEYTVVKKQ